jgi:hypothetical protein
MSDWQPLAESDYWPIRTADDANAIREAIESVFEGWFADTQGTDWEDFLDRMDGMVFYGKMIDMGDRTDSPAIRQIKRIVKQLRQETG